MRQALDRSGKAVVGKVALRNKEQLVPIYALEDVLIAHILHWPDEMKPSAEASPTGKVELANNEIDAAIALIDALSEADLDAYEDQYTDAVVYLVQARTEAPRTGQGQRPSTGREGRRPRGGIAGQPR